MNDRQRMSHGLPVTRRTALVSLGAAGVVAMSSRTSLAQSGATPAAPAEDSSEIGSASMPNWRFTAVSITDPYSGTLTKPSGLPPGVRVVSVEVIITNDSDQPLEFSVTDIRLRDESGAEYRAGDYLGSEPRVVSQNLPDGERTRGWVWFGLPQASKVASIVFIAPPPVLRVSLG